MTGDAHTPRELDVAVDGGDLRVGVWEPRGEVATTMIAIHGITASHRCWPFLVDELPGVRVVAPDLRGRGRSSELHGPSSMARHADDVVAVMDALDIERAVIAGHSMGAFVAVVLAHRHPDRVSRLVLIDGGLPLEVPEGLSADELVSHVLGPTAARLSMRFSDVGAYLDFWRAHPAFAADWSAELERYLAYDLVPDGAVFRPATSLATTTDDTIDLNTGSSIRESVSALAHPTLFVTVPRGLQDQVPGLYSDEALARILETSPGIRHERLPDLNHYTVTMSRRGARALRPLVARELAAAAAGERRAG